MKKLEVSRYLKNASTDFAQTHLKKMIPIAAGLLKVPRDMTIAIAPIRAKDINGQYLAAEKIVQLDTRKGRDFFSIIDTLMHEMVHAEQYHTGKMESKICKKQRKWVRLWDGAVWSKKGTTYSCYRKLPWEVEAFARSAGLAEQVFYEYQRRTGLSMTQLNDRFIMSREKTIADSLSKC